MNQVNTDDRERCNIVNNKLDSASAVKCQFPLLLAVAGALFKLWGGVSAGHWQHIHRDTKLEVSETFAPR